MNLFEAGKIGCFLDSIVHSTEDRRGTETKVLVLTVRVDPFDHQLATALDQRVRTTLFKLNHPDPQPHLRRADFTLGIPKQNIRIFATPDSPDASICLTQVAVKGIYARGSKDANGYVCVMKLSFGPVGRAELEYCEQWRNNQAWIAAEEAEPSLEFEEDDDDEERSASTALRPGGPAPEWDDGDTEPFNAPAASEDAPPPPKKRGRKKTAKHDPETERSAQKRDGRKRTRKVNGAAEDKEGATA